MSGKGFIDQLSLGDDFQKTVKAVENLSDEIPIEISEGDTFLLSINKIVLPDSQPREHFDPKEMENLTASIKAVGVLQPLIVSPDNGQFVLYAGERRLRAAKKLKLKKVPVRATFLKRSVISIIENIQREQLKPLEEAKAYKGLMDDEGYSQVKLAKTLNKGRSTIVEILSLNKLPDKIKKGCRRADISKRTLVQIAKLPSEEEMLRAFDMAVKHGFTSLDFQKKKPKKKGAPNKDKQFIKKAKTFQKSLAGLRPDKVPEKSKDEIIEQLNIIKKEIVDVIKAIK